MNSITAASQGQVDSAADAVYRKVAWRLIPLLFLCYIAAYLDRVNVAFAKLQMLQALQLSEAVYGWGAGIFFIGYFIFEIPRNVMLHRVGAGRWIARIMVSWALLSAAMMFVNSATSFYIVRFLLGVAEAGFFPGIILYLTYWYPAQRRARMVAVFMSGVAVAGVVGGPLSGWIMKACAGLNGWSGWQWLFLLEGLPSVLLGVWTWFYLDDGIGAARWLSEDDKQALERELAGERSQQQHLPLGRLFGSGKVWLLALVYFLCVMGLYGVSF